MRTRINKTFVAEQVEPGEWKDDKLIGFGFKRTAKGKGVFFVETKVRGTRRSVTVTIGSTNEWTAEAARNQAMRILNEMSQGIDPNEKRKEEIEQKNQLRAVRDLEQKSKSITLSTAFSDYLAARSNLKESTAKVYTYVFNSRFRDWLATPIVEITSDMVQARHKEISLRHPADANHAMRVLRAIFHFASEKYQNHIGQPLVQTNPVRRLSAVAAWNEIERRKTVIKAHQLKDWYSAVSGLKHGASRDYLLLILFTGMRKNEAARLMWKDVDMRDETILVRDPKNGEDLLLPMSNFLRDLMKNRWQMRTNEYVFPGKNNIGFQTDYRHALELVVSETGKSFMLHDLRRTFASIAYQLCTQYEVKRLLNHKDSADVTSGYIVSDVEQLRAPMQRVTDAILGHAGVKTRKSKAVIQLPATSKSKKKRRKG